jgi:transposase
LQKLKCTHFTGLLRTYEEQTEKRKRGRRARRWVVERIASWINRFRRLLVRWEKKAVNFLAMLHLAFVYTTWRQTRVLG